jgi:D-glycero-D-manno-heptose 1,7-bisphosphate phosphatase
VPARLDDSRPGVLLDRDGTLIDFVRDVELGVVTPAFTPAQIRFLPGALDGLGLLRDAGFTLAVATNQPQAAKGQLPKGAIERTNAALIAALEREGIRLAGFEVCFHHPTGGPSGDPELIRDCDCRKPKAGMLDALVVGLGLDRARTWMIGDTRADAGAARAAGIRAALLMEPGRCELCPLRPRSGDPAPPDDLAVDIATSDWVELATEVARQSR